MAHENSMHTEVTQAARVGGKETKIQFDRGKLLMNARFSRPIRIDQSPQVLHSATPFAQVHFVKFQTEANETEGPDLRCSRPQQIQRFASFRRVESRLRSLSVS